MQWWCPAARGALEGSTVDVGFPVFYHVVIENTTVLYIIVMGFYYFLSHRLSLLRERNKRPLKAHCADQTLFANTLEKLNRNTQKLQFQDYLNQQGSV